MIRSFTRFACYPLSKHAHVTDVRHSQGISLNAYVSAGEGVGRASSTSAR
jgi:hypothetical protein